MNRLRPAAAISVALAIAATIGAVVVPATAGATVNGDTVAAARRELVTFIAANPIGESGASVPVPCRLATPETTAAALGLDPVDSAAWLATVRNDSVLRSGSGARVPVVTCAAGGWPVELFAFESAGLDFPTVAARFDVGNVMPATPRQLGGQAAGRCVEGSGATRCTVVWMRDGLVVGVRFTSGTPAIARQVTSRGLDAIAPVIVDTLIVGLPTTTTTTTTTTTEPSTTTTTVPLPTVPPTDPPTTPPTTPAPTVPPTTPAPTEPPTTPAPTEPPTTLPPPSTTEPIDPVTLSPYDVIATLPEATLFRALVDSLVVDPEAAVPDIGAVLRGVDPAHPHVVVFVPTDDVLGALPELPSLAVDPVLARQFVLDLIVDGSWPPEVLFSGATGELATLGGRLLGVDPSLPGVGGAPLWHVAPSRNAGDVYLATAPVVATDPPPPPTEPPPPPTELPTTPAPTEPPPPPTELPTTPAPTEPPPPPTELPTTPAPTEPPPPPTEPPTTPVPTEPALPPLGTLPADPTTATPYDVLASRADATELRALIDTLVVDPASPVPDIRAVLQGSDPLHPQVSIFAPTNDALLARPDWPSIVADPFLARQFVLGLIVDGPQPPEWLFADGAPAFVVTLEGRVLNIDRSMMSVGGAPVMHVEPSLLRGNVYVAGAVPELADFVVPLEPVEVSEPVELVEPDEGGG